jgi:hypothetical protein
VGGIVCAVPPTGNRQPAVRSPVDVFPVPQRVLLSTVEIWGGDMGGELVRHVRASSQEAHQYLDVNNPARRGYRTAALLAGLLLAAVGVVALVVADDVPFSGHTGHGWLGLILNRAGGVLLLALAAVVVFGAVAPGNLGAAMLTGAGALMLVLGLAVLAVNRTSVNVVAFSIVDVCMLFLVALGVLWCGMHSWESGDWGSGGRDRRTFLAAEPTEYQEPSR